MSMLALLQDPNIDSNQVAKIMAFAGPLIGLFVLIYIALTVLPLWFAFKKAGLSPALALIALIPNLGLIVCLFILAFAKWKVIPAPEYGTGYPPQPGYPGQGYIPQQTGYAPPAAYGSQPVNYAPASNAPVYPPPADTRTDV